MHEHARSWVQRWARLGHSARILDVGGRNINGSVRDDFPDAGSYTALDLVDGPGVDVVADFATWDAGGLQFDLVLYLEVAEHTPSWRNHLAKARSLLSPAGALIVTCAGPDRLPHSAVDGGPLRDGEFYANLQLRDLHAALLDGFDYVLAEVHPGHPLGNVPAPANPFDAPLGFPRGDLYAMARLS